MSQPKTAGTAQGIVCALLPLFAMLGAVLIAPILGVMSQHFSDTPNSQVLVPLLLTAPALCLALLSPLAGMLGNRIGYRPVILVSLTFYGITGVAPIFLESLHAILISRLLVGIAEAGIVTCCMAIMSHYFTGDDRQKWFTITNIAMPWAGAVVIAGTGMLGSMDWRLTFASYGLSLLVLVAAVIYLFEPVIEREPSTPAATADKTNFPGWPVTLRIVLIAITGSVAFYIAPVKLAFLLQDQGVNSPSVNANIMALGLVVGGPSGAVLARLLKHRNVGTVLAMAMGTMTAGLAIMALGNNAITIGAGTVIQQMGGGMMLVTAMTYVMSLAQPNQRGTFSGIWWFTYTMANFVTPLLMSALLFLTDSHSASVLAAGGLIIVVCLWLLTANAFRRQIVEQGGVLEMGGH
ncbi:MFS transporter [Aestuariicella hydrocarbonica]|uniref:MFS transporter n=1 Tax=Pseudomaricurvus hydrocarbonicus TaxID=1470433 RepID=A0A9E5T3Q8_9GAMM|nr:MFS transporter [Aestuariicella hydrocarbonica]NHO67383.1 MFS transporter [Aestuariicella hydrocarbonica]